MQRIGFPYASERQAEAARRLMREGLSLREAAYHIGASAGELDVALWRRLTSLPARADR